MRGNRERERATRKLDGRGEEGEKSYRGGSCKKRKKGK